MKALRFQAGVLLASCKKKGAFKLDCSFWIFLQVIQASLLFQHDFCFRDCWEYRELYTTDFD